MNRAPALLSSFAAIALAVACADLKTADPTNGGDGGASSSSGTSGQNGPSTSSSGDGAGGGSSSGSTLGPGGTGPGPYGALPFGYCCSDDSECRSRNCASVGSQKMCLDACRANETCQGKGLPSGFTCDGSQASPGSCQPPSGFECVPANKFVTGTKGPGSCCSPTGNGLSGTECAGGFCDWYKGIDDPGYDPPWFCTNPCEVPGDCGKGMRCLFEIGRCVPANEPFVCE